MVRKMPNLKAPNGKKPGVTDRERSFCSARPKIASVVRIEARRPWGESAAAMIALASIAGCARAPQPPPPNARVAQAVGPARCARNRAAGPITFLTSFGYAPTSGILDVVAAQRLGWFDALCLDVVVRPGSTNAQLVSAGTAQIAGLGDAASAIVAIDRGARIVGIATYANTSAVELFALRGGPVASLSDLPGKVIGYKVAVAPQVSAMLRRVGVPLEQVKFVSVPFNPSLLADGHVAAMIGYKSNEPRVLVAQGRRVIEWDPDHYGIRSTFNVLVANRDWALGHPEAVEDFLRATLRAYRWIGGSAGHLTRALGFVGDLSTAGFDPAQGRARWGIEASLIAASQPPTTPFGYNAPKRWQAEARTLAQAHLLHHPVRRDAYDNRFVDAIYRRNEIIWPAP